MGQFLVCVSDFLFFLFFPFLPIFCEVRRNLPDLASLLSQFKNCHLKNLLTFRGFSAVSTSGGDRVHSRTRGMGWGSRWRICFFVWDTHRECPRGNISFYGLSSTSLNSFLPEKLFLGKELANISDSSGRVRFRFFYFFWGFWASWRTPTGGPLRPSPSTPSVGIQGDSVRSEYCCLGDFFCPQLLRCLRPVGPLTGSLVQSGGIGC